MVPVYLEKPREVCRWDRELATISKRIGGAELYAIPRAIPRATSSSPVLAGLRRPTKSVRADKNTRSTRVVAIALVDSIELRSFQLRNSRW
jgi:hypothetical protein